MADVLRSELLDLHGFQHGFSLRGGGVSEAPYESLNLGRAIGDAPEAVEENHRRLAEAVGYAPGALFEVSQVHGREILDVGSSDDPESVRVIEADALVAVEPGLAVGVRVADCVSILLADPASGAVAAVHAGWRGVVAEILPAAIERLHQRADSEPVALLAVLGPHIRLGNFEVGEDVARELQAVAPGVAAVDRSLDPPHVDLTSLVRAQLLRAGLRATHIDDLGGCTHAERARFYSYRRDGADTGRHLATIVSLDKR